MRDLHTNVRSIPDVLAQIEVKAREVPKREWIVGVGSPMQDFRMPEKRFPSRAELDAVAPDHPVSIGFGAHVTIANSAAPNLAGVTADTEPPGGGAIELDPDTGAPTGKPVERAQYLGRNMIPPYSYEQMKRGIVHATEKVLRRGVTTIHDIVTNHDTDMAPDATDKAVSAHPRAGHRHRVEHLGNRMLTQERLDRIRRLGVRPVPNIAFLNYISESLLDCMGPERLRQSFPTKTLLGAG